MKDICERLRDAAHGGLKNHVPRYAVKCGELREAADEIERLRAALEFVRYTQCGSCRAKDDFGVSAALGRMPAIVIASRPASNSDDT